MAGNRITLPDEFIQDNEIKQGDLIAFVPAEKKRLTLVPVVAVPRGEII